MATTGASGGKADPNVKPSGPSTTQNDVDDQDNPTTGEKGMGAQKDAPSKPSRLEPVFLVHVPGDTSPTEHDSESDAEQHAADVVKALGVPVSVTTEKRVRPEKDGKGGDS